MTRICRFWGIPFLPVEALLHVLRRAALGMGTFMYMHLQRCEHHLCSETRDFTLAALHFHAAHDCSAPLRLQPAILLHAPLASRSVHVTRDDVCLPGLYDALAPG